MKHLCVFTFTALLLITNSAQAKRALASSNGCMGCHAETKFDGPPWPELARKYKKFQGQADAAQIEGEKLRKGGFFKKVKAHQKLSPAIATELMQWIIDGAN
jgi:cytochrome c551/c552